MKKYEAEKRLVNIVTEADLDNKEITKEKTNILRKTVTSTEYEDMYKNFLKENKIDHSKVIKMAFNKSVESKFVIEDKIIN